MQTFISSLPDFTLVFSLPIVGLLLMIVFLISFIILPMIKVNSYKREGVTTFFYPILGFFAYLNQNLKTKGDMMAGIKENGKPGNYTPKYLATHLNNTPFILLQDSRYIKELLQNPNNYKKTHLIDVFKPLEENGLISAEGEVWKRHRKIISASFNFEFLKMNLPVIQNTVKEFFDKLSSHDFENYSAIHKIEEITGEIVGRIFFGESLTSYTFEGKSLPLALAEITAEFGAASFDPLVAFLGPRAIYIPFIPKYRRMLKRAKEFRSLCFKIINDRKSKPYSKTNDLLASLLATQDSPDIENQFTDTDIVDEFITLVIAGTDTTARWAAMTLYSLAKHPQYLSQLQTEREATYNQEQQVTTDMLNKMELLHAVLKETLRFYPPSVIPFIRKAVVDHDILDLKIKKGDLIDCAILGPAYDKKTFENPEQFRPERWMNTETRMDPYAFTPFSGGPRNCIGQHLAYMEAKVIVSEFLERFEFDVKEGYKLKMLLRFLYEPQDELIFNLRPKLQQKSS